ncbi:AraC family transcriptional regulator [Actinoplanes utahensis]|uniref:AraC family transcriptional regulator n=1 Tax=Actinoplanes utahensis TaxID=1869 RepID=A0A0A6UTV6_ACTUT|nr:AraC family transcriptional regulator [Actinoplanes utahensis]KHD77879.1 AraC family transcriptional regulator [Actinoplanes utahensis]GIF32428.1 AraC family transcriptional regulator [Actinoplanes utahensis]
MDVINEAVGGFRTGRVHARRIHRSGSWGMRFPAFTGVGFHVVLHGAGWLVTAGEPPAALRRGDIVLAPHGAEHGLSHAAVHGPGGLPVPDRPSGDPEPEQADFILLCGAYRLDRGQVHRFLQDLPAVIAVSPDYDRHPELRAVAGLLSTDVAEERSGAATTRSALVDLMLVHVLRQWQEQTGADGWPAVGDPAIAAALREIHGSPQRPWTVQQLGAVAGMSRTAFTRRFHALVGTPPMAYLTGWRLSRGARLLRETTAPLAAIARQVGYSTEYAFAAAFRREYGISPGRFRQS